MRGTNRESIVIVTATHVGMIMEDSWQQAQKVYAAIATSEVGKNALFSAELPENAYQHTNSDENINKIGLFKSYYFKSKDHLAEKGDTARHGNIKEAGINEGVPIDGNHRPKIIEKQAQERFTHAHSNNWECFSRLVNENETVI